VHFSDWLVVVSNNSTGTVPLVPVVLASNKKNILLLLPVQCLLLPVFNTWTMPWHCALFVPDCCCLFSVSWCYCCLLFWYCCKYFILPVPDCYLLPWLLFHWCLWYNHCALCCCLLPVLFLCMSMTICCFIEAYFITVSMSIILHFFSRWVISKINLFKLLKHIFNVNYVNACCWYTVSVLCMMPVLLVFNNVIIIWYICLFILFCCFICVKYFMSLVYFLILLLLFYFCAEATINITGLLFIFNVISVPFYWRNQVACSLFCAKSDLLKYSYG
jgi:hypothetical protein